MTSFNLKQHLTKKASMAYEGSQGYFLAQSRAWMNCIKCKQVEGKSAQEAWQGCFDDFQKGDHKLSWIQDYAGDVVESVNKGIAAEASSDYSADIAKYASSGMELGTAVNKALQAKIAQTNDAASQAPDPSSKVDPADEGYALLRRDQKTGEWAYYGEDSTPEKVVPTNLSRAKRFNKQEAESQSSVIGQGFKAVPVSQGDMTKGGLLLG